MQRTNYQLINDEELPVSNEFFNSARARRLIDHALTSAACNAGYREKDGCNNPARIELVQSTDYMITAWVNGEFQIVIECNAPKGYGQHNIGDIVG